MSKVTQCLIRHDHMEFPKWFRALVSRSCLWVKSRLSINPTDSFGYWNDRRLIVLTWANGTDIDQIYWQATPCWVWLLSFGTLLEWWPLPTYLRRSQANRLDYRYEPAGHQGSQSEVPLVDSNRLFSIGIYDSVSAESVKGASSQSLLPMVRAHAG
jgi:hypothetical protein